MNFKTLLLGSLFSLSLIPTSVSANECRYVQRYTYDGNLPWTVQVCDSDNDPQLTREQKDFLQSYDATTGTVGKEHCNDTLEWMGMCNR